MEVIDFPELQDLALRSATTGQAARFFRVAADGTWAGMLDLVSGPNHVEVRALADDGTETRADVVVHAATNGTGAPVPPELAARRNALLEQCLQQIRTRRAETELERANQLRRELLVEIERERAKARKRAAEQRRELKLEVEE